MTRVLTENVPSAPEAGLRARVGKPAANGRRASALEARAKRLEVVESELDRLGGEVDRLRRRDEAIPQELREELREAGRRRLGLRWSD